MAVVLAGCWTSSDPLPRDTVVVDGSVDDALPDAVPSEPIGGEAGSGFFDSEPVTPETTATVVFDPPSGTMVSCPSSIKLTLTSATPGAVIHFTVDGTNPNTSSSKYSGPFEVTRSTTFKALAIAPAMLPSEIVTALYSVTAPTVPTGIIRFSPPGGTYSTAQTVTLASDVPGSSAATRVCYTLDGTTPTSMSTCAPAPATVTIEPTVAGANVKAIGLRECLIASEVTTATYSLP